MKTINPFTASFTVEMINELAKLNMKIVKQTITGDELVRHTDLKRECEINEERKNNEAIQLGFTSYTSYIYKYYHYQN